MGLGYDDFCKLDFDEFASIYQAYIDQRDFDFKDRWNRMRMLATIAIQPHLSKGKSITPEKLLPFPWDRKKDKSPQTVTAAEQRRRMEELVKKLGDEII